MALDEKLAAWVEAGLIDAAAADRIRAHEAERDRPVLLWAVAGLGLFALALGIALLVAANWDRIPAAAKLCLHLAATAGIAALAWHGAARGRPWLAEGALFGFAALLLAGIALQAQIFQLTGAAWEALIVWLALAGPALLIGGRSRLTGYSFAAMLVLGPTALAVDTVEAGGWWRLVAGAAMASPLLLLLLAERPALAERFRQALAEAAIPLLLGAASIAHFAWASHITPEQAADNRVRLLLPALAAAVLLWVLRAGGRLPRPLVLPLALGPLLATFLALGLPHPDLWLSRVIGLFAFAALWGAVAAGAARAGLTALFGVAVGAIALRLFIVYLELFGSLAATGGGLVAGGLLLVALAWGWRRVTAARP